MLLRRLLHSSRHLRQGVQTLTTATTTAAAGSSSALPFRRLPALLPSRYLSPRLLSSSGRDDDTNNNKPWKLTPESGDPDPFADVDADAAAAGGSGEAPLGSGAAVEDPWAKGFRAEDDEKGNVFEEIFKEEAVSAPVARKAAPASTEQWTFGREEEENDDPFAASVLGEGIVGEGGELGELDAAAEEEAERERQEKKAREQELMEILKGPNRAFGDLIAQSGISEDLIDSLILLKDLRDVPGLPPLSEIQEKSIQRWSKTTSRAEAERQKQEEISKARVRQVDEKGRAYGTGKRKCSIARVWIQPGNGKFIVNDKQFDVYFPILDHRADLLRPFTVTKTLGLWDVTCTVKGGGVSGQVGAIRLGISRALQNWEPGLRPYLKEVGYLTRDSRIVERKKPGKAKARKSFQWVKR